MLIGLTGRTGAGKDEVGRVLKRAGYHGIAFADALRVEVADAWNAHIGLFCDRAGKDVPTPQLAVEWCMHSGFLRWISCQEISLHQPRSPRWVLQQWGTWRRAGNPLHWVGQVEIWLNHHRMLGHDKLVITDVRLPNEALMVGWRKGRLVRVHRPGLPPLPPDTASHESERHTELRADADLHNDGDLRHLEAEVARVLQVLQALPAAA